MVEKAEIAAKTGYPAEAVKLLLTLSLPEGSCERELLLDAASDANDWRNIINVTTTPFTIRELVQRVGALIETHEYPAATDALDRFSGQLQLSAQQEKELRKLIRANEVINK